MRVVPDVKGAVVLVDGYVRVSQVRGRGGERFISPLDQRARIEGWAQLHGARIGRVFEELDESGARPDRPLLEEAITRIENGVSHGLVVAKLDRFGRSLMHGVAALDRIQRAGGVFVSVDDGFDLRTDTGRLIMRIMLAMGEWQLDRIRDNWNVTRKQVIARGIHLCAIPPAGYQRGPSGRLIPDEHAGPIVTELFVRRARGESLSSLCRWLESKKLLTGYGNAYWGIQSTRGVLANRAYLGEAYSGEFVHPDAHPPLTDAVTWQLAQHPRSYPARPNLCPTLLGGLLRCAGCSMKMHTAMYKPRGREPSRPTRRGYACHGHFTGGICDAPATAAGRIEVVVEEVFFDQLRRRLPIDASALSSAERRLRQAESALERYRDNDEAAHAIGPDRFAAGLRTRVRRIERALLGVAAARANTDGIILPSADELERRWPTMTDFERRTAFAELIEVIFVYRGPEPAEDRIAICLRGTAPEGLPSPGRRSARVRRFNPAECSQPPLGATDVAQALDLWSLDHIQTRLTEFLGNRTEWPPIDDFRDAGYARLHEQVVMQGGSRWWAQRMGIGHAKYPTVKRPWTEQRIRASLCLYLADKTEWPLAIEFERDGLKGLYDALKIGEGIDRWAAEFGFDPPSRRGPRLYWTDERVESELRRFIGDRTVWPSASEFCGAHLNGLLWAVRKRGGIAAWAARLGLPRRAQFSGRVMTM